jgi:hypothetical protein
MTTEITCDICGRPLPAEELELDVDELWICAACRPGLVTRPVAPGGNVELDEPLRELVGQSAGAICRTLDLPFVPPYDTVITAAARIAYDEDRYMSGWSFLTQWLDGTTVWLSPEKHRKALVTVHGEVQVVQRG